MLESNFSKVAGLISCNFIKKKLLIVPCSNTGVFMWNLLNFKEYPFFYRTPLVAASGFIRSTHAWWIKLICRDSGTSIFLGICEIFKNIIDDLRWLLLSLTRCETSKYTVAATCNVLIVWCTGGRYSRWGNRFLPITEVYLEPRQKSAMKLFRKNS